MTFRFDRHAPRTVAFVTRALQTALLAVLVGAVSQCPMHAQSNGALREVYTGIPGETVADLVNHPSFPNSPAITEVITAGFETPTDSMDEYGQRVSAYVVAPASGDYVFWIASDDNSILYLSTDEQPANKQAIASVPSWTNSRQWDAFPEQQSPPIALLVGQRYYIEALMKEGTGGDNLAVRWQLPGPSGDIEEPIPNARLQVFGLGPPEVSQHPTNLTVIEGEAATFTVQLVRSIGATYQWLRGGTNVPGATNASYTFSPVALTDDNAQFRCFITNPQGATNSNTATLDVQPDTIRPTLVSVANLGDPQSLTLLFSEPVEAASATQLINYSINNGISIGSAAFAGDSRTIVLGTSPLSSGVTYTLSVNNVRDRAATPNTILPTQRIFTLDFTPLDAGYLRGTPEPLGPSSRNTPLTFSEIMYNPLPRADGRETEFIEIHNSSETAENIGGFRLTGEVSYTFSPNTMIPARGFLVVAPVPADVQAAYGISGVLGGFTNRLGNSGGLLRLRNRAGAVLLEVNYLDEEPWPVAADNGGHSLVLARPSYGEDDPRAWAASDLAGGTPGSAEVIGANPHRTVFINEFLAHTDEPVKDFIELFNYSTQTVNLAGCILTDDPATNKFVIPGGTNIPARGFVSFNQDQLAFALDASGETIYLKNPAGTRIIDVLRFGPQENGVSSGRYPDGTPGIHRLQSTTPGSGNALRRTNSIVINEIMFNPITGDDDDEFVELYNRGGASVNLSGWRLRDGIDYTFPAGFSVAANGYVVVARNALQLMGSYTNLNSTNTVGDYQGSLANGGEGITLTFPDQVISTNNGVRITNTIHIAVDEVFYTDGGRSSRWADGGGSSLELIDPHGDNRLMANWADSDESGKSQWALVEHTGVLDHGQGAINELHVLILGGGECLVDNLEVIQSGGGNLVPNGTFEAGAGGWIFQGNHVRSGLGAIGTGFTGNYSLHVRASSGGDNGANRVETDLSAAISAGNTATIRGRARWLRGHPDILFRLHGNHLEAVGSLPVPRNLGTPGSQNSRHLVNAGPAVLNVQHSPILPSSGQAVVVTARIDDPDGLSDLVVRYRVDPSTNYASLAMTYRGAGLFSATLPGQAAGSLVAFYIQATDGASPGQSGSFPANPAESECLVRFGDPTPAGNFGVYRLWMTQRNINTWTAREKLSNESLDSTFVYGNRRVVYGAGGRYRGSPFLRPSYNTPTGTRCAYVWSLPEDDLFLGADELNLDSLEPGDRDPTALREITSFWMAEQLGLPFSYQRYVHTVVNGVANASRGIPIYADTQQPDSAYMRSWFSEDDTGEIFKIDDWFEFNDSVAREFNVDARLENYVTTGGVKKQARYRWSWEKKFNRTLNDDYTRLFSLVDAMNSPDAVYVSQVDNTIDADDWIMAFALRHAVGDWDGYGYSRGKNQFVYKPTDGKWKMLLWDLDFSLGCNGGHPPTQDLYQVNDSTISRLYNHPHFRRAYLHALHRIAYGPFEATNAVPFITAKYNSLTANGVSSTSPFVGSGAQGIPVPDWISQRRSYIITSQLAGLASPVAITSNGGVDFAVNNNLITLSGTAPIQAATIRVNGVAYRPVWTSSTVWNIQIALPAGANNLVVQVFDYNGLLAGQDTITITFTGTVEQPQDALVINEIMYNPAVPSASFVEIHNKSAVNAFDVSNFRLNGADFAFPEGTIVPAGGYLIVANSVSGFIAAYGNAIPISGIFSGTLDNGGETLQLIKPGPTPAQDSLIDQVTYDDDAPWPGLADGFGPSLQLIDSAQDNNRVANWASIVGSGGGGSQPLINYADAWKYNQTGGDLGTTWRNTNYSDAAWPSGPGLLAYETAPLPLPIGTQLATNTSRITFYFRKTFNFTGNPAVTSLQLTPIIDDGAVFYLNGFEVLRLGMPTNTITYTNLADRTVGDANIEGPFALSTTRLVQGTNVLAVEVHQVSSGSSDVVFGLALTSASLANSPYTPGAANSVGATLPTLPPVWLNEIQPNNASGLQDNFGDRDPWVELYNSGTGAIDLTGYYLSDNYTNLLRWAFPGGTVLGPGQFRFVWLDNEPGEISGTNLHASFRASPTNGSVVLTKVSGSVTTIVDYLNYSPVNNDRSYGAYPDGTPARRQNFYFATPGGTNNATYPPSPVFINEWMAGNTSTLTDLADGDFDDWFELFNAGPAIVDLSGFTLTDDLTEPDKWTIPNGTVIPSGGFLLVWADEEIGQAGESGSDLHADFKLGLGGENIGIYAPNGSLVGSVTFGQQTNDVSQGRWPDANSSLYFMTTPTPRSANLIGSSTNTPPVLTSIGDRSGNEGSLITFTASAVDPNTGQNLMFTLDAGASTNATINPGSGVFSWTPTESQGPGVYPITVRVTDNGSPPLGDFETINVTVGEVNTTPTLLPIGNQAGTEGQAITFIAQAVDADLPLQALRFSLEDAPTNATINATNGAFTWTPTEFEGPGSYPVTVVVADAGAPSLNAAETIIISVAETNAAPVLAFIGGKSVVEGTELSFTAFATDPDWPINTLTFTLDPGSPTNAVLDPNSGAFTWTPAPGQALGTNMFTIRVADNGVPVLEDAEAIAITVTPAAELRFTSATVSSGGLLTLTWTSEPGKNYTLQHKNDLNATNWISLGTFNATNTQMSVTNSVETVPHDYFRVERLD